ncbi:ribonuclease J [Brachybacterium sp. JHP9]|uniref:Ribonuclease J n=1 Tax=Brachybacterium equifaecis TaxID=2910770 RepID=A0ABT0QZE4_9MICO|nr:ribonuclease J [Brachybacterium equifaecis]MCL6422080.1 ribonuclease J [Brachybacterium equifaecis]
MSTTAKTPEAATPVAATPFTEQLNLPPKLRRDTLRVIPLGGLGDVGRNMAVLEYDGRLLIIDCGVLFPEETQPGVDLILPDFDYLRGRLDDIAAIVLTHGHEDHIGAVPYLLRLKPDIPLVGSQLTLALVEAKLREHRIRPYTFAVHENQQESFGPFDCEFVAVNHSIPDALAVYVSTPAGSVLHTGDFKMDQLPLDGRLTDLRAFARLGEKGVDLFMTDSTNAEVPGFTTQERTIGPVLDSLFARSKQKIVVASFSSHVHRVQQVLDAAAKNNRKVAFVGRSMVRNMGIAVDLGYLHVPKNTLVDVKQIDSLRDEQVVLMCTGSQGDAMAALNRIANQDHRVSVGPGDVVIFASSLIPGNENDVFRMINKLMALGAEVVHQGSSKVHVSGHASEGELLYCYNIVKPKNVMPVHGEVRHLIANGKIAESSGVPEKNVVLAHDGSVVDLKGGVAKVVGEIPNGYVYVDGSSVGEISEADLKDRRVLADEGFISLFAVVNSASGAIIAGPEIHSRGVAEDDAVLEKLRPEIVKALEKALADQAGKRHDPYQLQQAMRRVVGRYVGQRLRRRPMIIPVVVEV